MCGVANSDTRPPRRRRRGRARAPPRPTPHRHRPMAQHGSARRRSGARSPPNTAGATAPAAQVSVVLLVLTAGSSRELTRAAARAWRRAEQDVAAGGHAQLRRRGLPDIDALHHPTFRRRAFSTGERGPRRRRARSGLPPGPHGSDQRPAPSAERCSSATRRYGQLSPTPQTPQGPNARGRHRTHEVAIDRKPGHELLVAAVRFAGDSGGGPATLQRRRRLRSS
jgi:hypothetical protein